ncbi:universal stress protein, partial [Acinetobacter baumannii]|nr:universal stress protein [Acinetobacter baumannii]
VDGSEISLAAARQAAHIAKAFGSTLTALSLVAVDPVSGVDFYFISPVVIEYFVESRAHAEQTLAKVNAQCAEEGVDIETQIIQGEISSDGILKAVEELGSDLIVIGSHGRKGFQKLILGSFAQDVLNSTKIQVLVVKE